MKSGSLVRVSLRLATLTLALAAGGYLLRPKPTPLPKLAAPVAIAPPVPIDAPAVADGWAHLVQAKIEPITFPGYSVRDTDAYDWLPDGRVLFARYADKTGHYELFTASASGITPLREFNRKRRHNLYADRYLSPGGYMDHLPPRISAPYCLPAPDGNQILWLEDSEIYVSVGDTPRRPDAYAVASLDGRTQREWHYWAIAPNWNQEAGFFGPDACWMRDSRHWVTPYFKQGLWAGFAVIDARRPHSWRVTRFRSTLDDNYHLLGESQDGSILAESWSAGEAGGESILRFRPDAPVATPEAIALRPPFVRRNADSSAFAAG